MRFRKKLKAFVAKWKVWALAGAGVLVGLVQFILWKASRSSPPTPPPNPLERKIEEAEVEAIKARVLAERDYEDVKEELEAVSKILDPKAQVRKLAELLNR